MNGSTDSKDLEHTEFLNRIKKTLYYTKLPVINCLSFPIVELAAELFTEVKSGHTLERLDVGEASRISRNACVSPCSLVLALLYIERLKNCNPEYLQQVAPSELFLVSLLVASKFLHEDGEEDEVFNKEWAQSGQMSITRINKLEKDFLAAIDWTVYVQHEDFWEKLQQLEKSLAYREVQKRGWCSYTEVCCLMNSIQLMAIARNLINVSSICLATYAAGLATLLGSTLVANLIVQTCLPRTSLDMRQSVNLQTDLTASTDLTNPLIDAESANISNDVLPRLDPLTCDVVTHSGMIAENNINNGSWLDSMSPHYDDILKNDHVNVTNYTNRSFVSDTNYSVNSTQPTISKTGKMWMPQDFATKKYHSNVNWKKIAKIISTVLIEDTRSDKFFYQSLYRSTALRIYY